MASLHLQASTEIRVHNDDPGSYSYIYSALNQKTDKDEGFFFGKIKFGPESAVYFSFIDLTFSEQRLGPRYFLGAGDIRIETVQPSWSGQINR